jgi:hypothetical protein
MDNGFARPLTVAIATAMLALASMYVHAAQGASNSSDTRLSANYSKAAMTALADIHNWKERARAYARTGIPGAAGTERDLRAKAYESVRQSQFVAQTPGDHSADAALQKQFSNVKTWVDSLIEARKNMSATSSLSPDEVDQNPDLQKADECEKAFNAMLGTGSYTDLPACR